MLKYHGIAIYLAGKDSCRLRCKIFLGSRRENMRNTFKQNKTGLVYIGPCCAFEYQWKMIIIFDSHSLELKRHSTQNVRLIFV